MIPYSMDTTYLPVEGAQLFTVILCPAAGEKFPTVILRNPYVDLLENWDENDIATAYLNENREWLKHGYAVVIQHCRGRGKSSGDCIPYINEREDGLALQEWIRKQPFYNGELYLKGGSYLTSVHYATAPFADDIKGAIFGIQDTERYNICYRNGNLKIGLHASWYVGMYKAKTKKNKPYTTASFELLPLKDFSRVVFDEPVADFDALLRAPRPEDPFWQTRFGGNDARGATDHVKFPVLFTTGFYDIYTGGIFDLWNQMDEESRNRSALVVSPYDHGDGCDPEQSIIFPDGKREQAFGANYEVAWMDAIRGKTSFPFPQGKVTYYRLFENRWTSDSFRPTGKTISLSLGDEVRTYRYNPYDAPGFRGGLSCNFGGTVFQAPPNSRHDILSVYTEPFAKDTFVKGKLSARLRVASDCEDTCFYVRISLEKSQGDYGLRDDITTLGYQLGDYTPNQKVDLTFTFDEHAFLIRKGERLRVDIASADKEHYVRHTNQKGLYSEQTTAKIANNTVFLQDSVLFLPVEE